MPCFSLQNLSTVLSDMPSVEAMELASHLVNADGRDASSSPCFGDILSDEKEKEVKGLPGIVKHIISEDGCQYHCTVFHLSGTAFILADFIQYLKDKGYPEDIVLDLLEELTHSHRLLCIDMISRDIRPGRKGGFRIFGQCIYGFSQLVIPFGQIEDLSDNLSPLLRQFFRDVTI